MANLGAKQTLSLLFQDFRLGETRPKDCGHGRPFGAEKQPCTLAPERATTGVFIQAENEAATSSRPAGMAWACPSSSHHARGCSRARADARSGQWACGTHLSSRVPAPP